MVKLLFLLLLALLLWRMAAGRWPWQSRLPVRALPQPTVAEARRLLGVPEDAGKAQIVAAHRELVARIHPDRGGSDAQAQAANAARDVLLAQIVSNL